MNIPSVNNTAWLTNQVRTDIWGRINNINMGFTYRTTMVPISTMSSVLPLDSIVRDIIKQGTGGGINSSRPLPFKR